MQTRPFGKTGLETTLLGFGGFHLLEIEQTVAARLLNRYLDAGGNYIETAAGYGSGESERKIGASIGHRRAEFILATKSADRDKAGFLASLDRSLTNLQTDHVDLMIMHAVSTLDDLRTILAPGGAMEGFLTAKSAGKARFVGISMHGQPDVLVAALKAWPFDAVMTTINYYDRYNFPEIWDQLIPLANSLQTAIILMKPLADGLLWQSPAMAFQYAFSQPVAVVVSGINTEEQLALDLALLADFQPLDADGEATICRTAPELGDYVCRQCGRCLPCPESIDIPQICKLEGYYDRQMRDGRVGNSADFALRERLRFWFGNQERARADYAVLAVKADRCTKCGLCNARCPYQIDVIRKLAIADYKLAGRTTY